MHFEEVMENVVKGFEVAGVCSAWKSSSSPTSCRAITIDPTIESALALALVVLVRTFLSFSLEIELKAPFRGVDNERLADDGSCLRSSPGVGEDGGDHRAEDEGDFRAT